MASTARGQRHGIRRNALERAILNPMSLSVAEFVQRWKRNALSESSAAQSHFNDLCDTLGEPHPTDIDPTGDRYTFERPVSKTYGGKGYADVWLRDHFAWEYKANGKHQHKDLKAAYRQINDYREDLLNPPLLVVCDLIQFQIHTNFTSTSKRVYAFDLDDLLRNSPPPPAPFLPSRSSTPSSATPAPSVPTAPTPSSPRRPPRSSLASPSASKSKSAP